jgi:xanthine dehydrogenase YagR molybdenum-binding subunit
MRLHEVGIINQHFGQLVNHDFASYHISANADVGSLEAYWLD